MPCQIITSVGWCSLPLVWCLLPELDQTLMRIHVFGWYRYCLADAKTLQFMQALWWWRMLLSGISSKICKNHVRCVKTLDDATCNRTTSLSRCMQAIALVAQLMFTWHIQCLQALSGTLCNWPMFPGKCAHDKDLCCRIDVYTNDLCVYALVVAAAYFVMSLGHDRMPKSMWPSLSAHTSIDVAQ